METETAKTSHTLTSLADLAPDPRNPREIAPEAAKGLGVSLRDFGDISGIVWNSQTGQLVCGHQRVDQLKAAHGDALVLDLDAPALITPSGERFTIRVVDWPLAKQRAANVAANNPHIAGEFTPELQEILLEVREEIPDFADLRLDTLLAEMDGSLIGFGEAPAEVRQNLEEIEKINAMRRKGNAAVIEKTDTERYLVIVFPCRAEKESVLRRLGLPEDERYLPAAAVRLFPGRKVESVSNTGRPTKSAEAHHAGATG